MEIHREVVTATANDSRPVSERTISVDIDSVRILRQEMANVLGAAPSRELLALSSERHAEILVHNHIETTKLPANETAIAAILEMIESRGFGRFVVLEQDWGRGWLLVESADTFEARLELAEGRPSSRPRCDSARGMLCGAWRYLRRRAGLPADVAAVEIACAAQGHPACRFAVGPVEELVARGIAAPARAIMNRAELEEELHRCRESEAMLREFVDGMPFGIFGMDLGGRFTFANQKALELTGLPLKKVLGTHYSSYVHPEDRPAVDAGLQRVAEGRAEPYPVECRIVGANGSTRPCAVDAFVVRDAGGKVVGFQGFVIDLSDRKRFGGRERSFCEALRDGPWPFFELEPEGRIRSTNERASALLRADTVRIVGAHLTSFLAGKHSSSAYKAFLEVASGRAPFVSGVWDIADAEGGRKTVHFHFLPDGPPGGKIARVLALAHDISAEAEARRRQEEQNRRYEATLAATESLVFETDCDGVLRRLAGPVEEVLGYSAKELMGLPFPPYVHADDLSRTMEVLRAAAGRGGPRSEAASAAPAPDRDVPVDLTAPDAPPRKRDGLPDAGTQCAAAAPAAVQSTVCRLRRKDGRWGSFRLTAAGVPSWNGEAPTIVGLLRDVTDDVERRERLAARESAISGLLDSENTWVVACDAQGRVTALSRAYEKGTGFDRQERIGRQLLSLVAPGNDEAVETITKPRPVGEEYPQVRIPFLRRDGSPEGCLVELEPTAMRDLSGKFLGVIAAGRDITEETKRKAIEVERNELALEVAALRSEVRGQYGPDRIIGQDPKMREIYETILAVGRTHATVLIQGETGTGKELVAKAIHYNSPRRDKPFVKVDCGALAETLLESELFGHVKGAFTGAMRDRAGRFELAHEGTIFLDEIHNLSFALQAKLLRVVQEGRFEKVGGSKTQDVDVRIIAATNEGLEELVAQGKFRKDLYYRLNVIPIRLPPLRERKGDIPFLVRHFIRRFAERHGKDVDSISKEALDRLAGYHWPGNVRELENVIEQAVVFCREKTIQVEDLRLPETPGESPGAPDDGSLRSIMGSIDDPERYRLVEALAKAGGNPRLAANSLGMKSAEFQEKMVRHGLPLRRRIGQADGLVPGEGPAPRTLKEALEVPERRILVEVLARTGGNKKRAAEILGLSRSALYEKLRKHGLPPKR